MLKFTISNQLNQLFYYVCIKNQVLGSNALFHIAKATK